MYQPHSSQASTPNVAGQHKFEYMFLLSFKSEGKHKVGCVSRWGIWEELNEMNENDQNI